MTCPTTRAIAIRRTLDATDPQPGLGPMAEPAEQTIDADTPLNRDPCKRPVFCEQDGSKWPAPVVENEVMGRAAS